MVKKNKINLEFNPVLFIPYIAGGIVLGIAIDNLALGILISGIVALVIGLITNKK